MKKILFLLLSIYSLSFATWAEFSASQVLQLMSRQKNLKFSYTGAGSYIGMDYVNSSYMLFSIYGAVYSSDRKLKDNSAGCSGSMPSENGILSCVNGLFQYAPNPDPLGGAECRDLFQKDGVAYTCNPNTNEATEIPYSNGTTTDPEDGKDVPNCNDGYSWESTINFPSQGTTDGGYNSYTCTKDITNPDGSITGDNGVVIGADGSITTPNPAGGSTTVYVDGSTKTIAPDGTITSTPPTTPPPTDPGTGTSGGSTGGTDSGTGSTTGGTSGTGSTGGTTGTDTGTGGTGSTGTGTTGTDSGTATGAGDCNDSNMTLTEKTLCKISNIFTPAGTTPTSNSLEGSSSLIDGVTSEYSTFKTNIANQGDTLKSLVYTSIDTVNQGFSFNISSNDVVSCPKDYTLDLSALNMANMNVVLDICLQTSKLKPYFYPLFLIMFSVGTTLITFRMLGVLI